MDLPRIRTERLELVASTYKLVHAELFKKETLANLLGAEVPSAWPPPLNSDETLKWTLDFATRHPDATGWTMWYFLLVTPDGGSDKGGRVAIGNGGFKGMPSNDGTVEIGYSLLEQYQGNGFATEAAEGLIRWAFSHEGVRRIVAETYPHIRTSIRVLEKAGFTYLGNDPETLTIRFELPREAWGG